MHSKMKTVIRGSNGCILDAFGSKSVHSFIIPYNKSSMHFCFPGTLHITTSHRPPTNPAPSPGSRADQQPVQHGRPAHLPGPVLRREEAHRLRLLRGGVQRPQPARRPDVRHQKVPPEVQERRRPVRLGMTDGKARGRDDGR